MRVNVRESKARIHYKINKAIQMEELWWNTYYNNSDYNSDNYWEDHNYSYIDRDYLEEPIQHCRQIDMESFRGSDYIRDMKIRKLLKQDKDITPRFGDIIKFD